jgi:hypothetical protein
VEEVVSFISCCGCSAAAIRKSKSAKSLTKGMVAVSVTALTNYVGMTVLVESAEAHE